MYKLIENKSRRNVSPVNINGRGFSIVEMLVATALFSIVMVIAVGSLLTMVDANRKAQSLKSVMNNLNFAMESMVRSARVGTSYHCENITSPPPDIATPKDCPDGGILFAFEPFDGNPGIPNDQEVYRLLDGRIERSMNSGSSFTPVTADEVQIDDLAFYVVGTTPGDDFQPKAVITIRGSAGETERTRTEFALQMVASQRVFDI